MECRLVVIRTILLEYTMDLHRETKETSTPQDDKSLSSKAAREMQRMMGDGNKTVTSISKERQRKSTPKPNRQGGSMAPTAIDMDAKSTGTMSAISNTSTKTSKVRAKLHREFADKFEAQSIQIAKLLEEKKSPRKPSPSIPATADRNDCNAQIVICSESPMPTYGTQQIITKLRRTHNQQHAAKPTLGVQSQTNHGKLTQRYTDATSIQFIQRR